MSSGVYSTFPRSVLDPTSDLFVKTYNSNDISEYNSTTVGGHTIVTPAANTNGLIIRAHLSTSSQVCLLHMGTTQPTGLGNAYAFSYAIGGGLQQNFMGEFHIHPNQGLYAWNNIAGFFSVIYTSL